MGLEALLSPERRRVEALERDDARPYHSLMAAAADLLPPALRAAARERDEARRQLTWLRAEQASEFRLRLCDAESRAEVLDVRRSRLSESASVLESESANAQCRRYMLKEQLAAASREEEQLAAAASREEAEHARAEEELCRHNESRSRLALLHRLNAEHEDCERSEEVALQRQQSELEETQHLATREATDLESHARVREEAIHQGCQREAAELGAEHEQRLWKLKMRSGKLEAFLEGAASSQAAAQARGDDAGLHIKCREYNSRSTRAQASVTELSEQLEAMNGKYLRLRDKFAHWRSIQAESHRELQSELESAAAEREEKQVAAVGDLEKRLRETLRRLDAESAERQSAGQRAQETSEKLQQARGERGVAHRLREDHERAAREARTQEIREFHVECSSEASELELVKSSQASELEMAKGAKLELDRCRDTTQRTETSLRHLSEELLPRARGELRARRQLQESLQDRLRLDRASDSAAAVGWDPSHSTPAASLRPISPRGAGLAEPASAMPALRHITGRMWESLPKDQLLQQHELVVQWAEALASERLRLRNAVSDLRIDVDVAGMLSPKKGLLH